MAEIDNDLQAMVDQGVLGPDEPVDVARNVFIPHGQGTHKTTGDRLPSMNVHQMEMPMHPMQPMQSMRPMQPMQSMHPMQPMQSMHPMQPMRPCSPCSSFALH